MVDWPGCGWSGLLKEVLAQVRHVRVERTYKSWDMGEKRTERLFMRKRRTERVCMHAVDGRLPWFVDRWSS